MLDVYLHHDLAGQLIQDEHGQMVFDYAASWLENPVAIPLSHSLPLRKERFITHECRGFFAGILPEQDKREIIAKNLGISARNDFAMLESIGGECAGAITFLPAGETLPKKNHRYHPLSDKELAETLKSLPRHPLLAGEEGVRLSLAGAQDKIAVHVSDNGAISIPLGGAPSTHILKPAIAHFEGMVFNEALCLNLAGKVGIPVAEASIHQVQGIDYLLVKRYDRKGLSGIRSLVQLLHAKERLHQEDFCQALGIISERKYQHEGGPSLKQCFDLLRKISNAPIIDIQDLLDGVIFNFLIGNHDAHGKNFSILYYDHYIQLAPLYDLICTVYYPNLSQRMAMKIGGEYDSGKIYPRHFEKFADETGLAKPMVKKRVLELADIVIEQLAAMDILHPAAQEVASLITSRCKRTLDIFRG